MNLRKATALLLALCLLIPCFAVLPAFAADEGVQLYHQDAPKTLDEARAVWPSNSNHGWVDTCAVGDQKFGQVCYYNNSVDGKGLPEGESMTITVPNVRILTRGYAEVILTLQYAVVAANSDLDIGSFRRFEVYASTDGGKTWSSEHASLASQELIGSGVTGSRDLDAKTYIVTSTDLACLVPKDSVITALRIKPYGNSPTHYGATRIHWMEANGYATARQSAAGLTAGTIDVPEETLRAIVVDRARKMSGLAWISEEEIETRSTNSAQATDQHDRYYLANVLYHGPLYNRTSKCTWEMLRATVNARGEYVGGTNNQSAIGMDCIRFVSSALGTVSNARHYSWNFILWEPDLILLGDLKAGADDYTKNVIQSNDAQAVYEGYAALQPGDYVATHYPNPGSVDGYAWHIRVLTEATRVSRSKDGTIDPVKSKVYVDESTSSIKYYWKLSDGSVVTSTSDDLEAYAKSHEGAEFLYGSSSPAGQAYTFEDLYKSFYLPYTLKEYGQGKVNDVAFRVVTDTTAENVVEQGLAATFVSNWPVLSCTAAVTDMATGRVLWQKSALQELGQYDCSVQDAELDAFVKALPAGAYELTVDLQTGPVTAVGGSAPTQQALKLDFAVGGASIPAAVKTLDTAGADGWAVDWLNKAFARGLLSGMNQSGFTRDVTRLQFADMAVRLAEVLTGKEITPAAQDSFTDTAEPSILKAKAAGIAGGYEKDGKYEFRPGNPITRQEICVMLDHVADYVSAADASKALKPVDGIADRFVDRAEVADWAVQQVARMTGNAVMGGKATAAGDAISPQANTTLQEAVTLAIKLDDMLK